MRRTLGWLSIGGAVCAAVTTVLGIITLGTGVAALFSILGAGKGESSVDPGTIETLAFASTALALIVLVLGILQLLLDLAVGVLAVVTLPRHPRALSVILLVSVALATALPASLWGLSALLRAADVPEMANTLGSLFVLSLIVVIPAARLAEFITGIVTAVIGDRPMSAVSPHP